MGGLPSPRQPTPMREWKPADQVSFTAFYTDRHRPYLRFAYLQLGSDADAEEAVDRTFDAVMDAWQRMLEMDHPEKYAWTILKHRIVDQRRKRKLRPRPMDLMAFEAAVRNSGADPYEVLTDTIQFCAAVRGLTERQRDAVVHVYGLDFTVRQTAAVMGIEESSVRSLLRLARNRLTRRLNLPRGDKKAG
ncbi:hypothetical protein GCM10010357_21330 [Streptomyces luteireticuli]|uniref:Sigma-70 family RNA polymerase sigma factor n=1 Tax=Streptomyces luteireticuli TaxID=173858 RepID=A0ABP3IF64_9ACTN